MDSSSILLFVSMGTPPFVDRTHFMHPMSYLFQMEHR